jgi:predicted RNase H-like nuclease
MELLRVNGLELNDLGSAANAPLDDVLDAAAAVWSAGRIAGRMQRSLPEPPERKDGLEVAIWY